MPSSAMMARKKIMLEGVSIPTRAVTPKAILGNRAVTTRHREISSQMREYFSCSTRRFTAWMTMTMAATASTISSIRRTQLMSFSSLFAGWRRQWPR